MDLPKQMSLLLYNLTAGLDLAQGLGLDMALKEMGKTFMYSMERF